MTDDIPFSCKAAHLFLSATDGQSATTQISCRYIRTAETGTQQPMKDPKRVDKSAGNTYKQCFFAGFKSANTDEAMQDLCGVTLTVFSLFLSLMPDARRVDEISRKNKMMLFLMKLKTGLSYAALGVLFSIHRTTASRCFLSVLNLVCAKTLDWIKWHHRDDIHETMPACFKSEYPLCRAVIDCTEIRSERPSGVEQQNMLYSIGLLNKAIWTACKPLLVWVDD